MLETVLFRFQPDAMSREILEKLFVGKQKEILLQKLTKEILRVVENRKQKHYLIIGPRGVGKSHFIALLYYRLSDAAVNASLVKLSEEEFSIYRVSDLLQRVIEMQGKSKTVFPDFENMSDESVITTALEELKRSGKSVVLFIENFNQVLGEQMNAKEVKRLRSLLQKENLFVTVASAPLVFSQVSVHDEPFFNFFEIVYLVELDKDELKKLLMRIAEVEGNQQFTKQLSKFRHKINAITTLTGGNPRIAILLYNIASREKIFDVEKAFFKILDDNTPYYQDIFRMMSGEQRRIFDALIAMKKPATPTEIAKKTRLKQNTVNAQMRRLEKDGYLVSRRFGRITKYEVREKLFRLWRELRKASFSVGRISILLEFLELWYSAQERETMLLKCFEHVDTLADKETMTEAGYWFSSLPDKRKMEILPDLIEKSYKFGAMQSLDSFILDERTRKIAVFTQIKLLLETKEYEELVGVLDKATEVSSDSSLMSIKAAVLQQLGRYENALEAATRVTELNPQNANSWELKGAVLGSLGRYEEALEAANKAIELNPQNANSWELKGQALNDLNRYEEALEAANKAIELNPQNDRSWDLKGRVLVNLDRDKEALETFTKAVELVPQKEDLLGKKAGMLAIFGRYEDALETITKAIELDPKNAVSWGTKGVILSGLDRHEEALEAVTKATELDLGNATFWAMKGDELGWLGRYEEALEAAKKAIELDPQEFGSWEVKGQALCFLNRYEEALEPLTKAIELNPKNADLWVMKGKVLNFMQKYEEALEAANKAIELNPKNADLWAMKGDTSGYLGRYEEALEAANKAIELNPKNADSWALKADILEKMNKDRKAIECLSQSIEINPKRSDLWIKKAHILIKLNDKGAEDAYNEALSLAETEISLNPNNLEAWESKVNALLGLDRFKDASNALFKLADLLSHPSLKKTCKNNAALVATKANFETALAEFERKNMGNARQALEGAVHFLRGLDEEDVKALAKEELTRFLTKIADFKNTENLRVALKVLSKTKGFEEFLSPFKLSLDIVETKDVAKFYDVQVEKREIIAGIVERLSGSKDLLPPEYKKIHKDS